MKSRVAILTTHRANNFGAMLQAYSLVMTCRELGADAEILDWRCPFFEKVYHKAWRMHRNPIPAIKHLIWFLKDERTSRKMFADFRGHIPMSRPIVNRVNLDRIESEYDVFIVGSDQVWNPAITASLPRRFDKTYLLDFVKDEHRRKYAYAASLGDRPMIDESLQMEFAQEWKSYDGITMRETNGADYVSKRIGIPVHTVVDPVLLHDVGYWRKVAKCTTLIKQKDFVLLYNLRQSKQLSKFAQEFAKDKELDVVDLLIPAQSNNSSAGKTSTGPFELLDYIDKAEVVFTGSFHCVALSIIYGKRLYVQLARGSNGCNSRMDTLFYQCGLTGEDVFEDEKVLIRYYDCAQKNENIIKEAVSESIRILSKMIDGSYRS